MKRLCLMMLACMIGLSIFAASNGLAQDAARMELVKTTLQHQTEQKVELIQSWESTSSFLFLLAMAAIVFGLVIAVLQLFKNKHCKIAAGIMAATISTLVAIDTGVYTVDHQTLKLRAMKARILVDDIEFLFAIDSPDLPEKDRTEVFGEIRDKLKAISELAVDGFAGISVELTSTAYASSGPDIPEWVQSPPEDRSSLFFVGLAESRSLKKAKEFSLDNALEKGVDYFASQFDRRQQANPQPLDAEALSEYLVKSAETVETHIAYDKEAKLFRYYTLLRLDRELAEVDIRFFSVMKRVEVPKDFDQVVTAQEPTYPDYYKSRTESYSVFLNEAQQTLPSEQYEKFIEGRQLRKSGRYEEAVPLLIEVTETYPDFYFAWYNLALAYHDIGDTDAANEAYQRAIELEGGLEKRDASLYNTYGYFLYQQGDYELAKENLKKALEIQPNHPKAKRNLAAVENAIEGP